MDKYPPQRSRGYLRIDWNRKEGILEYGPSLFDSLPALGDIHDGDGWEIAVVSNRFSNYFWVYSGRNRFEVDARANRVSVFPIIAFEQLCSKQDLENRINTGFGGFQCLIVHKMTQPHWDLELKCLQLLHSKILVKRPPELTILRIPLGNTELRPNPSLPPKRLNVYTRRTFKTNKDKRRSWVVHFICRRFWLGKNDFYDEILSN